MLLYLSIPALLCLLRLSHFFKDGINHSHALQRHLHPFPHTNTHPPSSLPVRALQRTLAPVFEALTPEQSYNSWHGGGVEDVPREASPKIKRAFWYTRASWRRMLIMQPSAQYLLMIHVEEVKGRDRKQAALLDCAETGGLRVGELWDITQEGAGRPRYQNEYGGASIGLCYNNVYSFTVDGKLNSVERVLTMSFADNCPSAIAALGWKRENDAPRLSGYPHMEEDENPMILVPPVFGRVDYQNVLQPPWWPFNGGDTAAMAKTI